MEKADKSRRQDDRPISRVLLEGLHDPGSPLSSLRGTPHIMRAIWDLIIAYWKTVIHLPGHQVENPNYVSQSDREDELIYTPYNDNPTCAIPFFLSPLMHPFTETTSGTSRLVSFPPPSGININMMPFVVGSSFKACRLPKYVRPYWELILACIGPELNKEAEPWWPKTSDPSDLGKVYFLTIQESHVEAGQAQRRPGVHVDSAGKVIVRRKEMEMQTPTAIILGEAGAYIRLSMPRVPGPPMIMMDSS